MGRPRKGWALRPPRRQGDSFTVRFTSATGQPRELSTGTSDPVQAAGAAAEIYARDLTRGPELGRPRIDPLLALDALFALYLEAIETTHDEQTCATYTGYARRFSGWFGNSLANVTPSRMGDYQRARLGQALRKTVRKERSFLNGFLAWCVEQSVLGEAFAPVWPKLPRKAPGVRTGKQRAKPVPVTVEQVRGFLAALPAYSRPRRGKRFAVRARFVVAYETALRPATLDALSIPEHWRPGSDDLAITDEIDKARYGRTLPLTPLARAALERTVLDLGVTSGPIFGEHDHRASVAKAKVAARLPAEFAPYDLRHGRANHLLDASGDMRGSAYVLGHILLTTTNKYLRGDERRARALLAAASSGGIPGESEAGMVGAKEGSRTPTRVTPLEPESTGSHIDPNAYSRIEGAKENEKEPSGVGFGDVPETLRPAAKYLTAMRAEWDVYDALALAGEGES